MHTLSPFVCGTFHNEYDDDDTCLVASPLSSPRKYKRKDSKSNPYSSRGLDKFSQLLADLDEKRQKIYSQTNPHDISFVRFVYSNTDDIVPVVVKVKKNNKDHKHQSQELKGVMRSRTTLTHTSESMVTDTEERNQPKREKNHGKVAEKKFSWDMGKPSFYLPVVMVLILLLLVVFGRSASTVYTCVLWYVISTVRSSSPSNTKMSTKKKGELSEKKIVMNNERVKKKEYVRGWSEKKMVVNEGIKKKDYVRWWSEKKMVTGCLLSPEGGADSEAFKNKVQAQIHISKAGEQ
ncbi:hypothetical protein LR48_Vigan07g264500 [Vigna angularis]|uniref:Uncharacterized protein n=2 Tax=Phaseolus angularis TaxID=3914 RepID=A0A0L9V1Y4_PHAAN|nr:uncharacterized protein HKW66_Vig0222930 [Vigna angularis]KOM48941.1 hypothetical protein LR48_Vigan07g264500 [Vigna angularis]BAT82585.1 hypothetical protein VIGAN_03262400 [Vigna angularis var. angularis]